MEYETRKSSCYRKGRKIMTGQEKIYRIAEYCGAKWVRLADKEPKRSLVMPDDPSFPNDPDFSLPIADGSEQICQIHALPNYLSDLNAIHEAVEKVLFVERYPFYDHILQRIMGGEFAFTSRATAKQRADALLEVMSLDKTMDTAFETPN